MVFSSAVFLLVFLPVFLITYYLVGARLKNYTILLFSIFFYAWGAPDFVFVVLGSMIVNFYVVQAMQHTGKLSTKRLLLFLSVAINLGLLLYFKYANFFIENVNALISTLGLGSDVPWVMVGLPVGISFFTFQSLTYSVDVYRRVHEPLKKLSDYILYILMFPQLIAGPIVRFNFYC
jgi:alginate O-acetyltransferase complex protein AlgI